MFQGGTTVYTYAVRVPASEVYLPHVPRTVALQVLGLLAWSQRKAFVARQAP